LHVRHFRMSRRPERTAAAATASPTRPWAAPGWLLGLLLAGAALVAYQRVLHAGFIWDDDAHLTRPDLATLHGLWRIWSEPGATQQYYPVLYSAFWLELHLWGYSAAGYHALNVVLHGAAAWLLFLALRRLSVPGAFLAAAAFALHPVCAESVAWVSEQKNTLSAVFYLAAALAYLRFDAGRSPSWYAAGTVLFCLALLSKTVTATLPAALLVVLWWKRGRLSWKGDAAPLAPWLALGAAAGAVTAWMERAHVGAGGAAFALGFADRFLVAGRALWFYFGKVFWPFHLAFIYPRWTLDPRSIGQDLWPVAAVAALAALYFLRRRSRAPLAVALLFAGTLFPALGFINVYPFRFSFVADHFEYLALAMMLSASAAGLTLAAMRLSPPLRRVAAFVGVAALGALTWRQTAMYADIGTLWQTTIARNPRCWMAHNNLGLALMAGGQTDEAISHYRTAIEIEPGFAGTHNNLGIALMRKGETGEAVAQYREALAIDPGGAETHNNLGMALRRDGRVDEAIAQYGMALEINPDDLATNFNLGNALLQAGRVPEAIGRYQRSLEISPGYADARNNLGNALRSIGRLDEAIAEYRRALDLDPSNARAKRNLEAALSSRGR
jgi:tetratricopeptide (TPR) repeat protein